MGVKRGYHDNNGNGMYSERPKSETQVNVKPGSLWYFRLCELSAKSAT